MKKLFSKLPHNLKQKLKSIFTLNHNILTIDSPTPIYRGEKFSTEWKETIEMGHINEKNFELPDPSVIYIASPTQRSGTNFLAELLKIHPALTFPNGPNWPEEHYLYSYSDELVKYFEKTLGLWGKWMEDGKKAQQDHLIKMMGQMGNGLLHYFYENIPENKVLLLKTPDAKNIHHFSYLFPKGKLVVIIRDGRDTVDSFVKSFASNMAFGKFARRWDQRMQLIFQYKAFLEEQGNADKLILVSYEKLNSNPEEVLEDVLPKLNLDTKIYPWENLHKVPVLGSSTAHHASDKDFWKPFTKNETFNPTGKWQKWKNWKKRVFKKNAGKSLIQAGYENDLNW